MDALERHEALMRVYTSAAVSRSDSDSNRHGSSNANRNSDVSQHDLDVLRAHHQFLRDDDADAARGDSDWQVRMSVRYYRRLFREYALADLSRYREGKVGLRWRTEREVVTGKGQFMCGNKRCDAREGLRSYELLFAYTEHGERKRCLVKVRVCEPCAAKLFYRKLAEQQQRRRESPRRDASRRKRSARSERRDEKQSAHRKRRRRSSNRSDSDSGSGSGSGSDRDNGSGSEDAGTHERSIHDLCAAINARERHSSEQRASVFFEDRTGSSSSDACDAFRDLLV